MKLDEYRKLLGGIPFGKRLPTALYVYRGNGASFGAELDALLGRLEIAFSVDSTHNILKFRTDELKISFLSYPDFLTDPHPALRHAITIDMATGKHRVTDYGKNANPPILHRKEAFIPESHPRRAEFAALTRAEEEYGLYKDTTTIGFKLNWERLLAEKGLAIEAHTIRETTEKNILTTDDTDGTDRETGTGIIGRKRTPKNAIGESEFQAEKWRQKNESQNGDSTFLPANPCSQRHGVAGGTSGVPRIDRHKTALTRYELSKPVKSLLEYGMIKTGTTFFDYGCGQGSDVRGLQALGHAAEGWDPVHRPEVARREADIVNMGYVVNVIEDPAERLEALVDAHRHAKRLLVVSGLIKETVDTGRAAQYGDGVVSRCLPPATARRYWRCSGLREFRYRRAPLISEIVSCRPRVHRARSEPQPRVQVVPRESWQRA